MQSPRLIVYNSHIHTYLVSVYNDELTNYKIETEFSQDRLGELNVGDILILTLAESELLKQRFNNGIKVIFLDMEGEIIPNFIDRDLLYNGGKFIYDWLKNKNHFIVSQRLGSINHSRIKTQLKYLPLFYYFSKFKFYQKSRIDLSLFSKPYDFITFLGKYAKKNSFRFKILKFILDENLSECLYTHNDLKNEKTLNDPYDFTWNILQSLQGKINIIFETLELDVLKKENFTLNNSFFTEKTLRALILQHPYILILNTELIDYLKTLGFKFPYDGFENYEDVKILIDSIKSYGIDKWSLENKELFIHNSKLIWELAYKKEDFVSELFN